MKATMTNTRAAIKAMLADTYTATSEFHLTKDEISGLLAKIAFDLMITGDYNDNLPELDGGEIPTGEIVEEYYIDLILPIAYDKDGANTLAPHRPTNRPVFYSYPAEEKNFPLTVDKVGNRGYFKSLDELTDYLARKIERLGASVNTWRYQLKCDLLGNFADRAVKAISGASAFATSTAYEVGVYVSDGTDTYIVQTAIPASNTSTISALADAGSVVKVHLVDTVSEVTDATSGEDFIETIKKAVEEGSFKSDANNLNGALQGVAPLTLYIKKGITPSLDVKTMAGAFNQDKLYPGVDVKVVDNFGSNGDEDNVEALLIDPRGCRLFTNEVETDEQLNGEGHFYTVYQYRKETPYFSPNTFIRVFTKAS